MTHTYREVGLVLTKPPLTRLDIVIILKNDPSCNEFPAQHYNQICCFLTMNVFFMNDINSQNNINIL